MNRERWKYEETCECTMCAAGGLVEPIPPGVHVVWDTHYQDSMVLCDECYVALRGSYAE